MNSTVARLTFSTVLSGWRGLFLALIPVLYLCVTAFAAVISQEQGQGVEGILSSLNFGTVVPLLALIIGTGAISTEIDDGSIVYLLTKPLRRGVIVFTKFVVATTITLLFAAIPTFFAGVMLTREIGGETLAYTLGAAIACVAYCALFLMLGALSRSAVVMGLMYVLLWENLAAGTVSAAGYLSVSSWAQSLAALAGSGADPAVNEVAAAVLAGVVTVVAVWFAGNRLRRLTLAGQG